MVRPRPVALQELEEAQDRLRGTGGGVLRVGGRLHGAVEGGRLSPEETFRLLQPPKDARREGEAEGPVSGQPAGSRSQLADSGAGEIGKTVQTAQSSRLVQVEGRWSCVITCAG